VSEPDDDQPSTRRVALVVTGAALVAFVVVAAVLVPWDPVPGGPLDPPSAGEIFSAAEIARAESYSAWARVWGWSSLVVNVLVLGWLGFSPRGRGLVDRQRGPWWVRAVLAVVGVTVVATLSTLPLAVAAHVHRRRNGLSTQAWTGFATDVVTRTGLAVVIASLVVLVLIGCARRWARGWPAVAGLVLASLALVGSFVYPVLVEPLFNSFEPLSDGPLRTDVLALADREGVPVRDVLVADASRRTTTLNAYVSGFGSTRRIVLYDNLVEGVPQDQALSVVAHELGHARHQDVLVGSALGALGVLVGVGVLGLLADSRRLRRGHGPRPLAQPAVVPLLLALVAAATLVTSPVQNGISRRVETRADVDALEATGDGAAFVEVQRALALRALSDPTPMAWSQFWFGSHPTTIERVALARRLVGEPTTD
jgi:STE24 endopeptidase